MADDDHKRVASQGHRDDDLDLALAKYAAVEPRAGLESRILANLQTERERRVAAPWWRWSATALAVAAIVIAGALVWQSEKRGRGPVTHVPSSPAQEQRPRQVGSNGGDRGIYQHLRTPVHKSGGRASRVQANVIAPAPKLEQFPSPQPLSEQERILADYVASYPEHAALIAQARANALRRDLAEQLREAVGGKGEDSQHSDQ